MIMSFPMDKTINIWVFYQFILTSLYSSLSEAMCSKNPISGSVIQLYLAITINQLGSQNE